MENQQKADGIMRYCWGALNSCLAPESSSEESFVRGNAEVFILAIVVVIVVAVENSLSQCEGSALLEFTWPQFYTRFLQKIFCSRYDDFLSVT